MFATEPLTDILSMLDARGVISASLEAGGDWALDFSNHEFIKFGAVLRGTCWLSAPEHPPICLKAGDCYLVAPGQSYRLGSDLTTAAEDGQAVYEAAGEPSVRYRGTDTLIIGGRLIYDPVNAWLLVNALPPIISMGSDTATASAIASVLVLLAREYETRQEGAAIICNGLAQILLVQALRAVVHAAPKPEAGWLSALADPPVAHALQLMHANPANRWTVAGLAKSVGMSRSGFAAHFKDRVGVPPLSYLMQWRMKKAAFAMRTEKTSIAEVAENAGYLSESAFCYAFKRVMGKPPKEYTGSRDAAFLSFRLHETGAVS